MHGEKGGRQGGWCEGFSMEKKRWDADSHDPLILTTKSWLFEGNLLSLLCPKYFLPSLTKMSKSWT